MASRAKARVAPRSQRKDADRVKGITVEPTETLRLMDTIGVSRASRILGVSTTTLHKARKYNFVSKVIEVASAGALLEMETSERGLASLHSGPELFLMELPPGQHAVAEKFVQSLRGKIIQSA